MNAPSEKAPFNTVGKLVYIKKKLGQLGHRFELAYEGFAEDISDKALKLPSDFKSALHAIDSDAQAGIDMANQSVWCKASQANPFCALSQAGMVGGMVAGGIATRTVEGLKDSAKSIWSNMTPDAAQDPKKDGKILSEVVFGVLLSWVEGKALGRVSKDLVHTDVFEKVSPADPLAKPSDEKKN